MSNLIIKPSTSYTSIEVKRGTIFVLDELMNDVKPLLLACHSSLKRQSNEDSLHCWCYDMINDEDEDFGEDFCPELSGASLELKMKLAVCVLNIYRDAIDNGYTDQEKFESFCEAFNEEDIDFEIGFDNGTFYPNEIGNWYDEAEFLYKEDAQAAYC